MFLLDKVYGKITVAISVFLLFRGSCLHGESNDTDIPVTVSLIEPSFRDLHSDTNYSIGTGMYAFLNNLSDFGNAHILVFLGISLFLGFAFAGKKINGFFTSGESEIEKNKNTHNVSSSMNVNKHFHQEVFEKDMEKSDVAMSHLAKGTVLEGNLSISSSLRVDGKIIGNVVCSSVVIIGEGGSIEGDIKADSMKVSGSIKGSADINNEFSADSTAHIEGDLVVGILNITEGAKLSGSIKMK